MIKKTCKRCGGVKDKDLFIGQVCDDCLNRFDTGNFFVFNIGPAKKISFSRDEFEALLNRQDRKCLCCKGLGKLFPLIKWKYKRPLVKGLICHKCKTILGLVKGDARILRFLANYLSKG